MTEGESSVPEEVIVSMMAAGMLSALSSSRSRTCIALASDQIRASMQHWQHAYSTAEDMPPLRNNLYQCLVYDASCFI